MDGITNLKITLVANSFLLRFGDQLLTNAAFSHRRWSFPRQSDLRLPDEQAIRLRELVYKSGALVASRFEAEPELPGYPPASAGPPTT
jgi:hypothetical protein